MTTFKKTSINRQMSVIFMLILFFSLIISGSVFAISEYFNNKNLFVYRLDMMTRMTTAQTADIKTYSDKKHLELLQRTFLEIEALELVCTYHDRQLFTSLEYDTSKCPNGIQAEGVSYLDNSAQVIRQNTIPDSYISAVLVKGNYYYLKMQLLYSLFFMLFISIITCLIAYYFLKKLQRTITKPILNLATIANQIATNKQYDFPEIPLCADEIQTVYLAFENMIKNIKENESELQSSEIRLQAIIDNSLSVISIKDMDGKYFFVNDQFHQLLKTTPESVIGLTNATFLQEPECIKQVEKEQEAKITKQAVKFEENIIIDDEIHHFFSVKVPLLDENKEVYAICTISTDITETKQQAEHLKRSQKMEALGKLTGGIAHDYNNMLAVIIGYAQLIESASKEHPKVIGFAQEIKKAGNRGAKLTSRLLSFSRTSIAEAQNVDVSQLILNTRDMLERTLTARIKLTLNLAKDIWSVWLDRDDLDDSLLNICINAMHAIDGDGELSIATENISLNDFDANGIGLEEGDYVLLTISDTGAGMDDDMLNQIFEPFYSTKGDKGSGLGLSQVYGFVTRSKGTIKVKSELGAGTSFYFYFPRHIQVVNNVEDNEVLEDMSFQGNESIIVVDDEKALAALAKEILSSVGYHVTAVGSAEEALKALELGSYDLLFSDVIMPGMSGYTLAKEVRKLYPSMKIQLVSGYDSNKSDTEEDIILKENILSKPYGDLILLKTIRAILAQD